MAIQSWQQLLLSHETGIHWITIHMTMKALTIGYELYIKQMHTVALWDPWVETLLKKESYTNPDDKGLSLHWYAIKTYTCSRVEEAH